MTKRSPEQTVISGEGGTDSGETRLLIADTRRLFAEALGIALREYPEFDVIDHYPAHGREVVNVVGLRRPDIVLLDFWIGEMKRSTLARLLQRRAPACRVILLSWFLSPREQEQAGALGFEAHISKDADIASLVEVIRIVGAKKGGASPKQVTGATPAGAPAPGDAGSLQGLISLTAREMDILALLAFRPKDIASILRISEKTVRNHIQNILGKTGARSAVEAVAIARRHGMI